MQNRHERMDWMDGHPIHHGHVKNFFSFIDIIGHIGRDGRAMALSHSAPLLSLPLPSSASASFLLSTVSTRFSHHHHNHYHRRRLHGIFATEGEQALQNSVDFLPLQDALSKVYIYIDISFNLSPLSIFA